MKHFFVYILLLFTNSLLFSQITLDSTSHFCAQDLLRSIQQKHDKNLKNREENIDEAINEYILKQRKKRTAGKKSRTNLYYTCSCSCDTGLFEVPVGTAENISDAQIMKGIEHFKCCLSKLN